MNWESFNSFGYVSVILWIAAPVLWLLHSKMKPRRWVGFIALVVSFAALIMAISNSRSHVNRLQLDPSAQMAAIEKKRDAKRQAALDSRGEDVAEIRFAEDGSEDYYDRAGMDDTELKYLESTSGEPSWKSGKKDRSSGSGEDDDLESLIGAVEEQESVNAEVLEEVVEDEPIYMNADDLALANTMDGLNLMAVRSVFIIILLLVFADYLRRANHYHEAYFPLPLPSAWLTFFTPAPVLLEQPESSKRNAIDELKRLTRRGDSFLYVTDDPEKAKSVPDQMKPLLGLFFRKDVLNLDDPNYRIANEFVFEALWFNRSSFVVNSAVRAQSIIFDFCNRLKERRRTRSKVRQTFHVVWDASVPMAEPLQEEFTNLAESSGMSLFIISPLSNQEERAQDAPQEETHSAEKTQS